jgi:hypothetical protein
MVDETKQTGLAQKDAPRELLTIKPAERLALDPTDSKGGDSKRQVGSKAKTFLSLAFKYGSEYDRACGIKFDGKNAMLGDEIVSIQDNDLGIGNKVYEGTVGLWELLTKQAPENYKENTVAYNLAILGQTKAHLKLDGTIKATKGRSIKISSNHYIKRCKKKRCSMKSLELKLQARHHLGIQLRHRVRILIQMLPDQE